jgi:hypothetical protein
MLRTDGDPELSCVRQVQQYGHGDWGVGRNPLVSVAAVAAGWVDRLQLLKVELGNRLQLLRQAGSFEIGREVIQPCSVFVLQIDERRYRCRPPPGPRRDARGRRWRGCAAVLAPPGTVSRLALSWGHWGDAEPISGHLPPPTVNRDCHVSRCLRPSDVWCLVIPFLCSIGAPFLRPDLRFPRAARAATVKTGRRPPPKAAQSGLDGGEHGARLGRVGGSAIMPPAAAPPFCARADRPC